MNPFNPINIPKRSPICTTHKERFLPGEEFFSFLVEEKKGQIQREDVCKECWNKKQANELLSPPFFYWKSILEEKKEKKLTTRVELALKTFLEMAADSLSDPHQLFFLALFLQRSKQIALRKEWNQEGILYHLYEVLQTEQFVTVQTINMAKIDVEQIQKDLAAKLEQKL